MFRRNISNLYSEIFGEGKRILYKIRNYKNSVNTQVEITKKKWGKTIRNVLFKTVIKSFNCLSIC